MPNKWLGRFEVTFFYLCLFFQPVGIGAWLAFKVAAKWNSWTHIIKIQVKDTKIGIDELEYLGLRNKLATAVAQKFLIGTMGNILAAAVGMGLFCVMQYLPEQKEASQMDWMIPSVWFSVWSVIALIISTVWGIYGWHCKVKNEVDNKWIEKAGAALSEFLGSFLGWCCLYVLIVRFRVVPNIIGGFDIFLGTVAVVGITGYSYRIVEALAALSKRDS
jgi:hypothetical protein